MANNLRDFSSLKKIISQDILDKTLYFSLVLKKKKQKKNILEKMLKDPFSCESLCFLPSKP